MRLDDIGRKYGSDKSSAVHRVLNFYESHLRERENDSVVLLEFCHSARAPAVMWRDYFPNGTIVAAYPPYSVPGQGSERLKIEIGNEADPAFLVRLIENYRFDIVIDDGSHRWLDQIQKL